MSSVSQEQLGPGYAPVILPTQCSCATGTPTTTGDYAPTILTSPSTGRHVATIRQLDYLTMSLVPTRMLLRI